MRDTCFAVGEARTFRSVSAWSMSNTRFRAAAICIILLILVYYVWAAGSNGAPLLTRVSSEEYFAAMRSDEINPLGSQHYGYYNLLADSFLAGKLSLLLKPATELLRLPDPYDPAANGSLRLHDASLYKGRYYLYFGPVPALLLFVPFRSLPFGKITEPFAVALFGFGAFLFTALILVRLARRARPVVSDGLLLLGILALGISNAVPFLLRRPVVYEVAISGGAFFIMLGFFFLVRSREHDRPSRLSMALLSFCWGLSVGCRPLYVFAGLALLAIWSILLLKNKERTFRTALLDGVSLAFPFVICLLALGLYNFLRFDSWTEFGVKYQLPGALSRPETMFRAGNIIPGLYFNTLRLPKVDCNFPFFLLQRVSPISLPTHYNSNEAIAGFLISSPIAVFLFTFWMMRRAFPARALVALVASFGLGILCLDTFLIPGASMRYQVDFIFPILLVALLLWLVVDAKMPNGWARTGLRYLSIYILLFGMVVHLAFGCTGYYDLFKRSHPQTYFALEDFFAPVSKLLTRFSSRNSPGILDVVNPGGAGTASNEMPCQWTGGDGFYLRFFSPTDATYKIMGDFSPNRTVLGSRNARLRFSMGKGRPADIPLSENVHIEWVVSLHRGVHRLEFFASAAEQTALLDSRQLVGISNLRIVNAVTTQQVQ